MDRTSLDIYLSERRALVDQALEGSLAKDAPCPLTEAMRYSLLAPGKRLRPILCLAACEVAGAPPERALGFACAVEMVHTASLIHDDLPALDNDDLRRGQPTCHKRFGEAVAILAGDALFALAFETMVSRSPGLDPSRLTQAVLELAWATGCAGIAGGQVLDVLHEGERTPPPAILEEIHLRKTARLFAASVVLGALAGGADGETTERLRRYGSHLGLAFQIADDILDVTKSAEELGKTPGKDVAAGKATFPARYGVEESRRLARHYAFEAVQALPETEQGVYPLRAIADLVATKAS